MIYDDNDNDDVEDDENRNVKTRTKHFVSRNVSLDRKEVSEKCVLIILITLKGSYANRKIKIVKCELFGGRGIDNENNK